MRRIVVTGMGAVSPLGCGVDTNWRRLVAGENGFTQVETFDVSDLPCKIAGMIPRVLSLRTADRPIAVRCSALSLACFAIACLFDVKQR